MCIPKLLYSTHTSHTPQQQGSRARVIWVGLSGLVSEKLLGSYCENLIKLQPKGPRTTGDK